MDLRFFRQKSFLIPFGAWVIFCSVMVALMCVSGSYSSLMRTLTQWDGQHYLSIARDGYEMFPCPGMPGYICGNIGWFPFYPVVSAIVSLFGVDTRISVLAVSWTALLLALILMHRLVSRRLGTTAALWSMVALLLSPASFYLLTAFPYSILLLLSLLAFDMMESGAFRLLWLPVGMAAVTYPSGIVLTLPVVFILITSWRSLTSHAKGHLVTAIGSAAGAIAIYFLYYWWEFGDFWLYVKFQGQSYYAHEPTFPLITIFRSFSELPLSDPRLIALTFALGASAIFFSRKLPVTWHIWLWGILLFTPTMGTTDCYYRHVVIVFPLAALVGLAASDGKRRILAFGAIALGAVLMWKVYLSAYVAGRLM